MKSLSVSLLLLKMIGLCLEFSGIHSKLGHTLLQKSLFMSTVAYLLTWYVRFFPFLWGLVNLSGERQLFFNLVGNWSSCFSRRTVPKGKMD